MPREKSGTSKICYVRRLGLVEAVKSGFGIFIKGKIQPSLALDVPRHVARMLAEKACRYRVNRENALNRLLARAEYRKKNKQGREFNNLVIGMPGWQRHRWAMRTSKGTPGYKGLAQKNVKVLKKFITNNPTRIRKAAP